MASLSLPPPTQPLTEFTKTPHGEDALVTEPWYRVFAEISRLRTDLDNLTRLTRGMGAVDVSGTATVTFVGSN